MLLRDGDAQIAFQRSPRCPEIARTLPTSLLRLMGYARGAYALGYVDDVRDPIEVLRPGAAEDNGLGQLERAREQLAEGR